MFVRFATIAAVIAASASVDARSSRLKGLLRSDDGTVHRGLGKGSSKTSKSSKGTKPICLSFGEVSKIKGADVVQTGEIVADSDCDVTSANWDSETCVHYAEPFMVNRDTGSTTTFVFDDGTLYSFGATSDTEPPLGDGAICGSVDTTAGDKLTLEYFGDLTDPTDVAGFDLQNRHLKHLQNMKYSFWVETCADGSGFSSCPNEFYLNVYARKSVTSTSPWYDCRFDFVPTDGGNVGSWTTFDLYDIKNIAASNVNPHGSSTCHGATTIQEYIDAVPNAVLGNTAFYPFGEFVQLEFGGWDNFLCSAPALYSTSHHFHSSLFPNYHLFYHTILHVPSLAKLSTLETPLPPTLE